MIVVIAMGIGERVRTRKEEKGESKGVTTWESNNG
jgi:hypothetical protein